MDGGILDNVPAKEVRKLGADKVIAVKFALNKKAKTKGLARVATKAIDIMFDKRSSDEVSTADYVIDIDLRNISMFDTKKINECYRLGYEQTKMQIDKIKAAIEKIKVKY